MVPVGIDEPLQRDGKNDAGQTGASLSISVWIRTTHEGRLTHMIPKASPFRRTNQSSRKMMVGAYAMLAPMPYETPWDAMSWVVVVAKELKARAQHMIRKPAGAAQRCRRGNATRTPKVNGKRR